MFDAEGNRRKLIIFTEPRDTVNYLAKRIRTLLGTDEAVEVIHGGVGREARRTIVSKFRNEVETQILVANDAACEGINLQRAHLMINYDLPWNPNKLEQRFGRIHRIGQKEVCHVWNLVAKNTREGRVFIRLLEKLEAERKALGGRVYDVIGELFEDRPLRELLVEAVLYNNDPKREQELNRTIEGVVDTDHIRQLLDARALSKESMSAQKITSIRDDMERAEARRLQPNFISSFFLTAFDNFGGRVSKQEEGRWKVRRVPARIQNRQHNNGNATPILKNYERICFERKLVNQSPVAEYIAPGHALLDAVIDLTMQEYNGVLQTGATLVSESDDVDDVQVVFFVEQTIHNGTRNQRNERQVVAREMSFLAMDRAGNVTNAGAAPYLDCRAIADAERERIKDVIDQDWLQSDLESAIIEHAVSTSIPRMLKRVRDYQLPLLDKIRKEVDVRLGAAINYEASREQRLLNKDDKLNASKANERMHELQRRLEKRREQIELQKHFSSATPIVLGACLVIPKRLLEEGVNPAQFAADVAARKKIELAAMDAVMKAERSLGNTPRDVSTENLGYDIESKEAKTEELRFIEVKGRVAGAPTVTVTSNEIKAALNSPDRFILALVAVDDDQTDIRYVRRCFTQNPESFESSKNLDWKKVWAIGSEPN